MNVYSIIPFLKATALVLTLSACNQSPDPQLVPAGTPSAVDIVMQPAVDAPVTPPVPPGTPPPVTIIGNPPAETVSPNLPNTTIPPSPVGVNNPPVATFPAPTPVAAPPVVVAPPVAIAPAAPPVPPGAVAGANPPIATAPAPTPVPTSPVVVAPPVVVTQPVVVAPPVAVIPVAPPVLTLKDQIALLEKSGKVAVLDRSDSVLGPDLNKNGVRDDIDAYIKSLNLAPIQTKAVLQDARAMQSTLVVDTTDKIALQLVGDRMAASTNCLFDKLLDIQIANQIGLAIESKTANTKIRVTRYLAYNSARSGSSTTLPSGDTCEK